MSAVYEIRLFDPFGAPLAVLDRFSRLDLARKVNDVGALELDLPPLWDVRLFREDSRLEVRRAPLGTSPAILAQTVWFVRRATLSLNESGAYEIHLTAYDTIDLLRRRIVAYAAGTSQTSKSGAADDVMKQVVRENLGALATDSDRVLPDDLFRVAADVGAGPTVAKSFTRRNVLTVLQEIAGMSAEEGTYLAFDVATASGRALEFRTYTGQRGMDRRFPQGSNPVLLAPEAGNVARVERSFDHLDEATVVYAGGQGEGTERVIATAADSVRIGRSPFGRIERFIDARQTADSDLVQADADASLRASRPRKVLVATIQETGGTRFGVDYDYGDYVTVAFDGELVDCRVEALHVTVSEEGERIDVQLRSEE